MKTLKLIITIIIILISITPNSVIGQSPLTNNTISHAKSLREMYGYNQDGQSNNLDMILSLYYKITYSYIYKDPHLKQKLIDEFLEDVKEKGYKVPKKVKVKNYFEPYEFILDLPIHLDKKGNIIPIDEIDKDLTSSLN